MALRSPLSNDVAIAFAGSVALPGTGAALPFCAATAAATSARARPQLAAGVITEDAIDIAQSLATSWITETAAPLRTAARMRSENRGWSLRRLEPITRARCRFDSDAIEVPSQRTPSG